MTWQIDKEARQDAKRQRAAHNIALLRRARVEFVHINGDNHLRIFCRGTQVDVHPATNSWSIMGQRGARFGHERYGQHKSIRALIHYIRTGEPPSSPQEPHGVPTPFRTPRNP